MPKLYNLAGQKFGRLTPISAQSRDGLRFWRCRCDCGGETEVRTAFLRNGHTESCGCLGREAVIARNSRHQNNRRQVRSSEYGSWRNMLNRCFNPSVPAYPDYGGRGITVCPEWRESFASFLAYLGPKPSSKHSIDRYPNNDGNYEPGNVRWATALEQAANRAKAFSRRTPG